jgi:hypothetical protein
MVKTIIILLVFVLMFVSGQVFAEYNRDVVVNAMRTNGALMGELKSAVAEKNYFDAAEALMGIAQSEKILLSQAPPKGSKAEWDRIHNEIIKAAFRGIGVCGEEDIEQLNMYIVEIGALIKQGHVTFRK